MGPQISNVWLLVKFMSPPIKTYSSIQILAKENLSQYLCLPSDNLHTLRTKTVIPRASRSKEIHKDDRKEKELIITTKGPQLAMIHP